MIAELFSRAALRPGMILGRYTGGSAISQAIVLRTAGLSALVHGTAWSHDGIIVTHNHQWYVGDAEMGHKASLTPIEEWEAQMAAGKIRAIVLWPTGITPEQGQAAAWWWQVHCYGAEYDSLAISGLAWRWMADKFGHKLGNEDQFYCTEGCAAAYAAVLSPPGSPWWPKVNPTPGTTRKRTLAGRFDVRHDAFTEAGRKHEIRLPLK